ncbi:response regulator [Halanaerobium praevalens]|uniref:Stage 0 sporulation protein A homolog n=1 Tax=Halanaerobium praevalens (strain ATCC 33744 / DSM 2228 / GSL) TaxID=572479 RepID=E3DMR2_HALPG|nr:response regulator [Halanaerobium praevalens]ADO76386.1 response regulator receiver protein [Halanaerobium praevalens DSM 2228]
MAKIIVVDDAAFMRLNLKQIMEGLGHEVIAEAENGKDAIEKYQASKPDIMFMDITMPEMDGIEAVKKIKEIDPEAKIIMCSAMGQKKIVINAITAGAKDFIVKPFKKDKIAETIDKFL